jgi:hypothetical protein
MVGALVTVILGILLVVLVWYILQATKLPENIKMILLLVAIILVIVYLFSGPYVPLRF